MYLNINKILFIYAQNSRFWSRYEGGLIIKGRFLVTLKITALETSHFACILSNQLSNHTSQNRSV